MSLASRAATNLGPEIGQVHRRVGSIEEGEKSWRRKSMFCGRLRLTVKQSENFLSKFSFFRPLLLGALGNVFSPTVIRGQSNG